MSGAAWAIWSCWQCANRLFWLTLVHTFRVQFQLTHVYLNIVNHSQGLHRPNCRGEITTVLCHQHQDHICATKYFYTVGSDFTLLIPMRTIKLHRIHRVWPPHGRILHTHARCALSAAVQLDHISCQPQIMIPGQIVCSNVFPKLGLFSSCGGRSESWACLVVGVDGSGLNSCLPFWIILGYPNFPLATFRSPISAFSENQARTI